MCHCRGSIIVWSCGVSILCMLGAPQGSAAEEEQTTGSFMEEIVVTAQKRGDEYLSDVAMSISAIDAEAIAKRGLQGMDDYLRVLPGTNYIDRGTARNSVIIRGITADPGRGGVITGVYIDETPVQGLGFGFTGSPDIGLFDIERVEVIRGPQGTLYGAGSMSGTVRTITKAPKLDALSGEVKLGASSTSGYGGTNSDLQAVFNVPLFEDSFGIRAVAYRLDKSGYIRNVAMDDPAKQAAVTDFGARMSDAVDDRGNLEIEGYRIGALWRISDDFALRFTSLGQEIDQDGVPTVDALQGPFEQSRFARLDGSDEGLFADLRLHSLVADYKTDNWSLIYATSWTKNDSSIDYDVGIFFLDLFDGVEPPFFLYQADHYDVFAQEIRWTWDSGGPWHLLLGGFYEEREYGFDQIFAVEGVPGGADPADREDRDTEQFSLFADFSYSLNDTWELSLGARSYDYEFSAQSIFSGVPATASHSETGETFKLGLNWRPQNAWLGEDPLLYASWAEGFRPGFPVTGAPPECDEDGDGIVEGVGLPFVDIVSDGLESVEIGYKSSFAEKRIAFSASLYRIDWTDFQVELAVPPPCSFTLPFNAGQARSEGLEISLSTLLTDSLQLDFSGSLMDVRLTEDAPGVGSNGDRLPAAPEYNFAIGLGYSAELWQRDVWARADAAWVGDYFNNFPGTGPKLGDYSTLNVAAGIDLNRWAIEVFASNLLDADEATWANPIWVPYDRGSVLRPRTLGARFTLAFGDD
jgi:iron complex outermembrane receptor protein